MTTHISLRFASRNRTWLAVAIAALHLTGIAQAAEVRVSGNVTSDVIASGFNSIEGRLVGDRHGEHMGTTGWVPATASGVSRGQDLGAHAPQASAQLNLRGRAALGDLGVFGDAIVSYLDPDGRGASASGGVHAEWFTGFRLLSDKLPRGARVDLEFNIVVDGIGALLADEGNSNYLLAQYSFTGGFIGDRGAGRYHCDDFEGTCHFAETVTLTAEIGRSYGIRGQLDLGVVAATNRIRSIMSNRASVDAGGSAHLYLDLLTPDVRYELDDSGLQFLTAPTVPALDVPAPPPALLLASALLVSTGARRRAPARS
ncbi:MAG: hypothetical protein FJX57_10785 [Alphaproteobacteria bacterium]|nr:hypothetical protein [Alphaproteobacteria bacterium]